MLASPADAVSGALESDLASPKKFLVYVATEAGPTPRDVMVIVSLMHAGDIEVRVMRGAPQPSSSQDGGATEEALFGVFSLKRRSAPCV